MVEGPEQQLYEASEKLGRLIAALPAEEKAVVVKLYDDVKEFAEQQAARGVHFDKAAFFAAGIVAHPDVSNEELVLAAVNLIERDWQLVKANQSNQATA